MTPFRDLLETLVGHQVEFVIIGGVAGNLHGSARVTQDLDIVYSRSPENLNRLVEALSPYQPYLRGAPPGLPFRWDATTIRSGLNFTLMTTLGAIDCLGEVAGGGTYEYLLPRSQEVPLYGGSFRLVNLLTLIALKRAAGRFKDLDAIAELEALREEAGES